jgi:hypothetical protein
MKEIGQLVYFFHGKPSRRILQRQLGIPNDSVLAGRRKTQPREARAC